jgi:signal peptidase I
MDDPTQSPELPLVFESVPVSPSPVTAPEEVASEALAGPAGANSVSPVDLPDFTSIDAVLFPVANLAPGVPADSLVEVRRNRPWRRIGQELVAMGQTLVSAAVYATLIVTFGFQVARVDGLSMEPTLEDHDRLIVSKIVYKLGDPRPGDIVMLYYPPNPEKMFVKRVIAREGDTVQIVDGRIYINDNPVADSYLPEEWRSHDNFGPEVIQAGYYFVMGDNRNNSSDSRSWGSVPKKYIVGKVKLRWWPIQDARVFE